MNNFVYIIIQSKYRAYQQKCLSYIKQKTVCNVLYCEDLKPDHYHACDNQNHGTKILYFLVSRHIKPMLRFLRQRVQRAQFLQLRQVLATN